MVFRYTDVKYGMVAAAILDVLLSGPMKLFLGA